METTNAILHELGVEYFSILLDEARDISVKEQMALALKFFVSKGCVVERFLGIVHVKDTKASSLKAAIEVLFLRHNLSLSKARGSLVNLSIVFTPVIDVLQTIDDDNLGSHESTIFGIARKDQDIVNAMTLVEEAK
ncbi:uncharacterized protein LOC121760576 [Salvia splendens]|uniref:uncharacterized protein LOC121760576 n=1 Tax=Salvia splendens TaxID=180675 RepID=UPI001C279505|nr:uncharacterized protein LOC121760576 [Salvia splendens]